MIVRRWITFLILCLALAAPSLATAQEPLPPEEQPGVQPAAEPEEATEAEIEEAQEKVQPVQEESSDLEADPVTETEETEPAQPGEEVAETPEDERTVPEAWWHTEYLIDYGLVALGGVGYVIGHYANPRPRPLFGAGFDFADPADSINFRDERIDRIYLQAETVPTKHLVYMVPGMFAAIGIEEAIMWGVGKGSAPVYHDTVVGFLESVSLTFGMTEVLKTAVGRLRPDFTERARLQFCIENPDDALCTDLDVSGITADELEGLFEDGRRSFPSGHASIGTNIYTYAALVLGGRFVWGNDATRLSRGLGIFFQTVSLGTGLFIATSRLDDGRHHDTDVFAGMLLGMGMANLAYWRRFGMDGLPLPRKEKKTQAQIAWDIGPGPGNGLSVRATF